MAIRKASGTGRAIPQEARLWGRAQASWEGARGGRASLDLTLVLASTGWGRGVGGEASLPRRCKGIHSAHLGNGLHAVTLRYLHTH